MSKKTNKIISFIYMFIAIFLASSIILLIGNKKFVPEENTNVKNSTDWFYKQQ